MEEWKQLSEVAVDDGLIKVLSVLVAREIYLSHHPIPSKARPEASLGVGLNLF